jgi:2-polyprenyl-6-methoxyphenol hydroxylase-like FAD-dependent oxidoreductase
MPALRGKLGKQAVVIGGGVGGLAAAAAVSDYFEDVIVLERDELPDQTMPRAGTPQARHAHALLGGGERALESLFPGFTTALTEAGAVRYRVGLDMLHEMPGYKPFPQRDLGWDAYAMSRPLIEFTVREKLRHRPNVTLQDKSRAIRLVTTEDGRAVSAVELVASGGASKTLGADLIIDASGRGAMTLDALKATNGPLPTESVVGIDMAYATCLFAIPDDRPRQWKCVLTFPAPPQGKRAAIIFPIEGNRWIVSLGGAHGDTPPGDLDGFLAFAKELPTTTIYRAIKHAEPLSEVARFAFPESVRRHFERLESFPRGLLPLGDSVCRFNPIYGQGMTVAAKEACVLRDLLAASVSASDPLEGLGPAFFAAIQEVIDTPWTAAAVTDFIYPETRGDRPADLETTLKFGQAIVRLAARDANVHKLRMEVLNLLKPRSVFRDPALVDRVRALMAEV